MEGLQMSQMKVAQENSHDLHSADHDHHLAVSGDHKLNLEQTPRSVFGKEVHFIGNMKSDEDVQINGRVNGIIESRENKIEVGADGLIHANVIAKCVIVRGEWVGDIHASEQVTITSTGKVTGNITTPDVMIEDGALVKGNIDMQKHDIFKQNAAAEVHDEGHNKSGFGFLFNKKTRDAISDVPALPDAHVSMHPAETLIHLSADHKMSFEGQGDSQSYIGPSINLQGELISGECVIIEGNFEGVIYFKNNNLGIGPRSQIKANVIVNSLFLDGEVEGDIYAGNLVVVNEKGKARGKIRSPRVSTEKGAMLMGSVEMESQNLEEIYAQIKETSAHTQAPQAERVEMRADENMNAHVNSNVKFNQNNTQQKDSAWPIFYPRS